MSRNLELDNRKRTHFLPRTHCTKSERSAIEAKAQQAGLSLSEYQRRALLKSMVKVQDNLPVVQAIKQLSGIGNNLNQLTRKAHIHGDYDRQRLHDILNHLEPLILRLME